MSGYLVHANYADRVKFFDQSDEIQRKDFLFDAMCKLRRLCLGGGSDPSPKKIYSDKTRNKKDEQTPI